MDKQIQQLKEVKQASPNQVFTMYLNTDPSDPDQQGGKWKVHFKSGLDNFEQYLKQDNKEELRNFQIIRDKVEKYVQDNEQHLRRGIIVFATATEDVWFSYLVQTRLETEFYWQEAPVLDQLQLIIKKFPVAGLILVQQNMVKVVESSLNEIQDETYFELDLNTEDWREKSGPRPSHTPKGPGSSNLQLENFESRYVANLERWYKSIASRLDKLAKDHQWKEIYVIGEGKAALEIKSQMNKNVNQWIKKNMMDHKEVQILKEVFG